MKYATLCSGIDGFGLGFEASGMECVFQCEINKDAQRVLKRHWPNVERSTDVTDEKNTSDLIRLRPDVVAFGSPCQDLSVAGRRGGLSAERSGLFFRCVELCFACEAPIVVWENVPGVFSSNDGRDFADVLEAFTGFAPAVPRDGWRNTGVCVGPLYSVAWRVLDAQWCGVPQRRRRVFVVGCLGDRGRPYEILSLADCLPWNSPPSRKTGASVARCLANGTNPSRYDGDSENFVASSLQASGAPGTRRGDEESLVVGTLCSSGKSAGSATQQDAEAGMLVTHTLRGEGFDASEDGTGRSTPIIPVDMTNGNCGGDVSGTVCCEMAKGDRGQGVMAFAQNQRDEVRDLNDTAGALAAEPGMKQQTYIAYQCGGRSQENNIAGQFGVRRLTPKECERLQGFPDDFTRWDADGKEISDSGRYRMLGNAVNVNVAKHLGRRIVDLTSHHGAEHE